MRTASREKVEQADAREQPVSPVDERGWIERNRGWVFAALATVILLGAFVLVYKSWMRNESDNVLLVEPTTAAGGKVYVTGAVLKPGVYSFGPGARVEEAVRLAGGTAADADLERLNMAQRLEDEQQVVVPRKASAAAPAQASQGVSATRLVNINSASEAELDTLPGVGPVTAQGIIAYRTKNGPFKRIEDLRELKLVNASTYAKIADKIVVQ